MFLFDKTLLNPSIRKKVKEEGGVLMEEGLFKCNSPGLVLVVLFYFLHARLSEIAVHQRLIEEPTNEKFDEMSKVKTTI